LSRTTTASSRNTSSNAPFSHGLESERQIVDAITAARSRGVSWTRIGELLGTSAQAAQQRYGNVITPGCYRAPERSRTCRSRAAIGVMLSG
jgi:hypothetical protein